MKPSSEQSTIEYYNQNGQAFFDSTVSIDMESLYAEFLPLLPKSAHILDVGCGSGRDSKAFMDKGYQVTAIDPSAKMAELASKYMDQPVLQQNVETLMFLDSFGGIWACASLLHVPEQALPNVFQRLSQALKTNGVLYVSFKLGETERQHTSRHFTDLTLDRLEAQMELASALKIHKSWVTKDLRAGFQTQWLNALILKAPTSTRTNQ